MADPERKGKLKSRVALLSRLVKRPFSTAQVPVSNNENATPDGGETTLPAALNIVAGGTETGSSETAQTTCWEDAARDLELNQPDVFAKLNVMKKKIQEQEDNTTFKDPPDLLKLAEGRKRKAGHIPPWLESTIKDILLFKDLGFAVAAFDPNRAARACWAGFCLILELLLNDATLLENFNLNIHDVTAKIKHWANIELLYLRARRPASEDIFKDLGTMLVKLYAAFLEFEVEIFHWCTHGFITSVLLSSQQKGHLERIVAKVKILHDQCSLTFDDYKMTIDQSRNIKAWISTYSAETSHANILEKTQVDEKYASCGEWLLGAETFVKWSSADRDKMNHILWLRGTVGTGKTTLVCRIIEWHLERSGLYPDHRFAYFYCVGDESSKTSYKTALLALLRQAAHDPTTGTVSHNVFNAYKDAGVVFDNATTLVYRSSDYRKLLCGILRSDVKLRVMIDALDQCDEPEELLEVLRQVRDECPHQLELLVSSRRQVQVDKELLDVVITDINTSMPKDEILSYITMEVKGRAMSRRLLHGQREDLEDELIDILSRRAGNMFRWAELKLHYFFRRKPRMILIDTVRKRLDELKCGATAGEDDLDATYDEIYKLNTADGTAEREDAFLIYSLMLFRYRRLYLTQMAEALAFGNGNRHGESFSPAYVEELTQDFTFLTPLQTLEFAHVSAVDYLRKRRSEYTDVACQAKISLLCMKCLSSQPSASAGKYDFHFYSHWFWLDHCAWLDRKERGMLRVSDVLVDWVVNESGNTKFESWVQGLTGSDARISKFQTGRSGDFSIAQAAIVIAILWDLVEIVERVFELRLSAHEPLSDLLSTEIETIFVYLSSYRVFTTRRHEAKRYLLHILSDGPEIAERTPLFWAAAVGSEEVAKLLLKHDQDPHLLSLSGHTPLSIAARHGDVKMVELLVYSGAGLKSMTKEHSYQRSICQAAREGHNEVIQILLDAGADPESKDHSGQTVLLQATTWGNCETITLLLNLKVNIESGDRHGQTPLICAVRRHYYEATRLLVNAGADPESADDAGNSPLSLAKELDDSLMLKMLSSR